MWKFYRDLLKYTGYYSSIEYKSRWECILIIFITEKKSVV